MEKEVSVSQIHPDHVDQVMSVVGRCGVCVRMHSAFVLISPCSLLQRGILWNILNNSTCDDV